MNKDTKNSILIGSSFEKTFELLKSWIPIEVIKDNNGVMIKCAKTPQNTIIYRVSIPKNTGVSNQESDYINYVELKSDGNFYLYDTENNKINDTSIQDLIYNMKSIKVDSYGDAINISNEEKYFGKIIYNTATNDDDTSKKGLYIANYYNTENRLFNLNTSSVADLENRVTVLENNINQFSPISEAQIKEWLNSEIINKKLN